ncbi:Retrovirus-related Pol polyprotein from transposon 17.6 [Vitis vinifera]|uniref:Retrovirus-related Pol polyprotein from transposon 17.6 n=1 Tax=Vitis vinifera TaxID=29760 RepID=A0A438JR15_VITVI|nr:Retrovirus-related Pol polyprotein from transposon 17.6 [Vitis vinifera]
MFQSSLEDHSLLPQMQSSIVGMDLCNSLLATYTLAQYLLYVQKLITPEEEEGPEEVCIIDTLGRSMLEEEEEILPLFNEKEAQEAAKEEIPKLNLKPLPMELKYTYLEENKHALLLYLHLLLLIRRFLYLKSQSPWVSPTQVVPKKSGITVVQNEREKKLLHASLRLEGYFQIEIDVEDQENHFTCPFGTYAYRRMPFGLCNAPTTFQRCMLSIFSDMVERIMEDLVLNWEKCHLWYMELSLAISSLRKALKLIKQRWNLLSNCHPQHCKRSKAIPWPCKMQKSFDQLKQFLTPSNSEAPNWQLPFEVMCDASDFAIGVVLGQREDGKPYVIYYASKTLNEAQRNYTTTEKELLAVVFALDKFRAYLVGFFIIVFTDHSALKDKKGVENVVADHLSRLAIAHNSMSYLLMMTFLRITHVARENSLIIRKCVLEKEQQGILSHCHENACGGHFASQKTTMKCCNQGPFLMSFGNSYILVGVDYVSKWVEAIPCKHNDHKVVLKFLKEKSSQDLGWPKAIISDRGLVDNQRLNMDLIRAGAKRCLDLNEMEELRNDAYINSKVAKLRMTRWHDQLISNKEFRKGQRVLLYDSRLHIFPGKLKLRWIDLSLFTKCISMEWWNY